MNAKTIMAWLLAPAAQLTRFLVRFERLWAHARLAALIQTPLHSSVVVIGVPEIHGTRQIFLGRDLFLYRGLHLETQQAGTIHIGDNVVISRGVHIVSHLSVSIGANCMIGEFSSIRDANHRFGGSSPLRQSGYDARPIRIGENVWIGRGVAILAGVAIGDNSVVGANAVVTHNVPAGTIVGGVPAHPIRQAIAG